LFFDTGEKKYMVIFGTPVKKTSVDYKKHMLFLLLHKNTFVIFCQGRNNKIQKKYMVIFGTPVKKI